ncbi:MAG: hypothetical protein WC476_06515 [Phycisphaerae bacterium]
MADLIEFRHQTYYHTCYMETLKLLRDYFPTAIFTGKCLVFISEDWRVEMTEHKDSDFSKADALPSVIRLKIFKKALDGDFIPGHYEDFQLPSLSDLAEQIEKYVQSAIGTNLRENIE